MRGAVKAALRGLPEAKAGWLLAYNEADDDAQVCVCCVCVLVCVCVRIQ